MVNYEMEMGDLFYENVSRAKRQGLRAVGEHFKLWGGWIYSDNQLVGLLSRPYKTNNWTLGAYLVRPGFEQLVETIREK